MKTDSTNKDALRLAKRIHNIGRDALCVEFKNKEKIKTWKEIKPEYRSAWLVVAAFVLKEYQKKK